MKTHKTTKGTELPLRDMRGKAYLEVAYRVLWMREEHADWGIETEFLELSPKTAIAKATIRDGAGKILAQGTKTETPEGFGDYIEKAETGAVGRALALCGYGTQFAQELDEGSRIVDAPRTPQPPQEDDIPPFEPPMQGTVVSMPQDPGKQICPFGNLKGRTFEQVGKQGLAKERDYWIGRSRTGTISKTAENFINAINQYLAQ